MHNGDEVKSPTRSFSHSFSTSWFGRGEAAIEETPTMLMGRAAYGIDVWCPSERVTGAGTSIKRKDAGLSEEDARKARTWLPEGVKLAVVAETCDTVLFTITGFRLPDCCFGASAPDEDDEDDDDLDFEDFLDGPNRERRGSLHVTRKHLRFKAMEQLGLPSLGQHETLRHKLLRWFILPIVEQKLRVEWIEPVWPEAFKLTRSMRFEGFIGVLIVCNSITIGMDSFFTDDNRPAYLYAAEHVFTSMFLIEWIIRVLAGTWVWVFTLNNAFDTFLIWVTGVLYYWLLTPLGVAKDTGVLHKLGCLRVLRLARLIRCVRMIPFFRELWILVKGVVDSLPLLIWSWVIIGTVHFMFAVITLEVVAKHETFQGDAMVQELFGTLPQAMFTLFQMMTFDSWSEFVRPMFRKMPECMIIFALFMGVAGIVLFNLMTAVVVKNAFDAAQDDTEAQSHIKDLEQKRFILRLREMFNDMDEDNSGFLTLDEFTDVLDDVNFVRTMKLLDIDLEELPDIFEILDDGDQQISTDEFVNGIMKMQGPALNKDTLKATRMMTTCNKDFGRTLTSLSHIVEETMEDVTLNLDTAHADIHQAMQLVAELLKKVDDVGIRKVCKASQHDMPQGPSINLETVEAAQKQHEMQKKEQRDSHSRGGKRGRKKEQQGQDDKLPDLSLVLRPQLPASFIQKYQKEQRKSNRRAVRRQRQEALTSHTNSQIHGDAIAEPVVILEAVIPEDFEDTWADLGIKPDAPESLRALARVKRVPHASISAKALVPFALSGAAHVLQKEPPHPHVVQDTEAEVFDI